MQTVPLYHKKEMYGKKIPGFLSAGQAKEIFAISSETFDSLPQCGQMFYSIAGVRSGHFFPKHVRDCAAAVLKRDGDFTTLVAKKTRVLFQQDGKLDRLRKLIAGIDSLDATLHDHRNPHPLLFMLDYNVSRLEKNQKLDLKVRVGKHFSDVRPWAGHTSAKDLYSKVNAYISGKLDEAFELEQSRQADFELKNRQAELALRGRSSGMEIVQPNRGRALQKPPVELLLDKLTPVLLAGTRNQRRSKLMTSNLMLMRKSVAVELCLNEAVKNSVGTVSSAIDQYIDLATGVDAAQSALAEAIGRELKLCSYVGDNVLFAFSDTAVMFLTSSEGSADYDLATAAASILALRTQEQSIVATWHQTVREDYQANRDARFISRVYTSSRVYTLKTKLTVRLDLIHPVCLQASILARSQQVIQMVDTSPNISVAKQKVRSLYGMISSSHMTLVEIKNGSSEIEITHDFVCRISALAELVAASHAGAEHRPNLPSELLFLTDATSSTDEMRSMLTSMATREKAIASVLSQCSDDPAVVEAATAYAKLLKQARSYVVGCDEMTLDAVVSLVHQVAMKEQAAITLWPPQCLAWWHAEKANRDRARGCLCNSPCANLSRATFNSDAATGVILWYGRNFEVRPVTLAEITRGFVDGAMTPARNDASTMFQSLLDLSSSETVLAVAVGGGASISTKDFLAVMCQQINLTTTGNCDPSGSDYNPHGEYGHALNAVHEVWRLTEDLQIHTYAPAALALDRQVATEAKLEAYIRQISNARIRMIACECMALRCERIGKLAIRAVYLAEAKLAGDYDDECLPFDPAKETLRSFVLDVIICKPADELTARWYELQSHKTIQRNPFVPASSTGNDCSATATAMAEIVYKAALRRRNYPRNSDTWI